jgi:long-chain fatty acid transport protein
MDRDDGPRRPDARPDSVPPAALLALACLLAAPGVAHGQGFGIYEHGTCTMGRAGAAVAEPCDDGSAMFFNPAGLAGMEGVTVSAGGTLISAFGDFTTDAGAQTFDLQNDPIPVPHGYAAVGIDDRLAAGLGVFVPYGLETKWPSSRAQGFEGRFAGYDNSLRSFYVQPTVAYRLTDRLAVGAGLDVVVGTVELNQRLDLSRQLAVPSRGITFGELGIPARTDFADASLDADPSSGVGGHFGVRVRATDAVSFGARYMTQVTVDYEGDAGFTQVPTDLVVPTDLALPGGTVVPAGTPVDALVAPQFREGGSLSDQTVRTEITMPDQLVAGVAVRPHDRLLLEADWQWVDWSDFDRIVIDLERAPDSRRIQNYADTHGVRVGGEYELSPRIDVRGGYLYHGAAAPEETVTPLLPEGARNELTAGVGVELSPTVSVDASYQYIAQNDRRGRVEDPLSGQQPTTALNSGLYNFGAHLFGTTLTLHF